MDFAPYQDTTPESTRTLSPPPNRTSSPARNARSPPPNRPTTDPFGQSSLPAPSHFSDVPRGNSGFGGGGGGGGNIEDGRLDVNLFETSLPLRLDYEAMLAYLLLPPAGGVFLLVVEHKSDYVRYVKFEEGGALGTCLLWARVALEEELYAAASLLSRLPSLFAFCIHILTKDLSRFHAWQSSLLFAAIFVSRTLIGYLRNTYH